MPHSEFLDFALTQVLRIRTVLRVTRLLQSKLP